MGDPFRGQSLAHLALRFGAFAAVAGGGADVLAYEPVCDLMTHRLVCDLVVVGYYRIGSRESDAVSREVEAACRACKHTRRRLLRSWYDRIEGMSCKEHAKNLNPLRVI